MSEPAVLYDEHDAIAVITLNRPTTALHHLNRCLIQKAEDRWLRRAPTQPKPDPKRPNRAHR